jgi:AcrR family transcriptional regulator
MLDAIAEVVALRGYGAATVADVIEAAGVSRKTFYEHFRDKEDCFLAAYDAAVEILLRRVREAYEDGPGPWRERIRRGTAALLEVLAAEPAFARMCIVEVLAAGPQALARYAAAMDAFVPYVHSGNDEIRGFPPVPRTVSEAIVRGATGVIYDRIQAGRAEDLPGLLPEIMYFAIVPYLGHEEAAAELAARPPA